uniref:solute carrier family 49 member A3-like n=1 Tax=Styela clava TaxID=7725 RepID=UPI001939CE75|nr:solute carrier family 49 member A3-like [Styela clava]
MEYKSFPQRWILLGVLCCVGFSQLYTLTGFVVLNNVVSQFYQVPPSLTDLLAIFGSLLGCPVGLISAYFSDKLALRSLMLLTTGSLFCGSVICTIGFSSGNLFCVTVIGRIIMTSSIGILYTTQVILAACWFPAHQTATALTLPLCFFMIGSVSASLIYPHFIPKATFTIDANVSGHASQKVTNLFVTTYCALSALLLICLCLTFGYCKNYPPSPPSRAQEEVLTNMQKHNEQTKSMMQKFSEMWTIVSRRSFVLLCMTEIFATSGLVFLQFLLPSFVLDIFPNLHDTVPGTILVISIIAGAFTMPIAGKLVDKYKNFKTMAILGPSVMSVCTLGIVFAYQYKNIVSLYILYFIFSIGRSIYRPSATELLLEISYPDDKLLVTSLIMVIINLALFSFTLIMRAILTFAGAVIASACTGFFLILTIVFVSLVAPDYKRHNAGITKYTTIDEQ